MIVIFSADKKTADAVDSFWYRIEIGDADEMVLISCDREGNTATPESSK